MKNVLKSLLFVFILFILLEVVGYFLLPNKNILKAGMYKVSAFEILGEKEKTVDAIAVGDSLIYTSISPMEIWNKYGYTVFDCSESAQIIPDAYEYLVSAVETQKPKVLFMEANILFRDPKNKAWYKKELKKLSNIVPIFKYHNNWKKILFGKNDDWIDKDKGYKYINKVVPSKKNDYMKPTNKVKEFPVGNIDYLDKILELCADNNIKFVLISTPSQGSWSYKKHSATTKLANEKGIEFIDLNLNNPLEIDWKNDTKDAGAHLNYYGAIKVSKFIGDFLKNSNLIEDHRNDSNYDEWNKAYKKYIDILKNS